jgi:hypothetical protein
MIRRIANYRDRLTQMKNTLALCSILALVPLSSQAKINHSAKISLGQSSDKDATQLSRKLTELGVSSYQDASASDVLAVNGDVTITNGSACNNGHRSYDVNLNVLDGEGHVSKQIHLDDGNECSQISPAQQLSALLDKWGASTLDGTCGLGHCWRKINLMRCAHFQARRSQSAFDSCTVELSSAPPSFSAR